jgi:hypothetical protein
VILFLRSITDAAEAVKYLQAIRENLEVRILQASENLGEWHSLSFRVALCCNMINQANNYALYRLLHHHNAEVPFTCLPFESRIS